MSVSLFATGRARWLSTVALLGVGSVLSSQDIGHRGPSLLGSGPSVGGWPTVTESKPESKVWYNDFQWWGSMWSATARAFNIHRLDRNTLAWVDTGVLVDLRPDSHGDALWDGTKLYIASHEFATGGGKPGAQLLLRRYDYAPATDTYTLDAGFPVTIGDSKSEILVIEKDSLGTVWAVWKQANRVYFAHTLGADTVWSAAAILPANTSNFDNDDICSMVRFGNRIGVMWSDQVSRNFFFTSHVDGAPDSDWSPVEYALPGEADDHLRLEADAGGRVYAIVKNRAGQTKLLVRNTGGWQQYLVCDTGLNVARAVMLLDEPANLVRVFYTVGLTALGGGIYQKSSPLGAIAFEPGLGTAIMQDSSGYLINNPSVTKQNVTSETGFVVLAGNTSKDGTYWFHEVPGVQPPPPPPPPGNGLVLNPISPGTAGVQNTLTVTGATPSALLTFYSGPRQGTTVLTRPGCPSGISLGIARPTLLGSARAKADGTATLRTTPPLSLAGRTLNYQVAEATSCRASNLVSDKL
jgi:hypothetical protein